MVEPVETLLHLGPLHPVEQALVFVLAFGPFVLLALTIWIARRRGSGGDAGATSWDRDDR